MQVTKTGVYKTRDGYVIDVDEVDEFDTGKFYFNCPVNPVERYYGICDDGRVPGLGHYSVVEPASYGLGDFI